MNIYLMQHGISNSKEIDAEEGLTKEGVEIIRNSAKALKKMSISFDVIICSSKKRSKETAQIIAKEFHFPSSKILQTEKVKPMALAEDTMDFIKN